MGGSGSPPGSGGSVDDVLAHFGVKGMKWGVRKRSSSSSGPTDVVVKTKPGKRVSTSGGKSHPASEDALRVAVSRQKARKSSTDSLSTKELRELVDRMNLEQQYSKLTTSNKKKSAGAKFAQEIVGNIAKQQVSKLANDVASKQIASMLAKLKT